MFRERIQPPDEASDPRVSRTRQLLQQALWEALHEADFSSISVQDITRRAQVNRATFYDHFADKFALMDYALRERFQQRLAQRLPPDPAFSAEHLRVLARVTFEFIAEIPRPHPIQHCAHQPPIEILMQGLLAEILQGWLALDAALPASAASMRATVLSWSIFGAAFQWIQTNRRAPADALIDELVDVIAHGSLSGD